MKVANQGENKIWPKSILHFTSLQAEIEEKWILWSAAIEILMLWQGNIENDIDHLNLATGMHDVYMTEIETRLYIHNNMLWNSDKKCADFNTKPISQVKQKRHLSGPETFVEIDSLVTSGPLTIPIPKMISTMNEQEMREEVNKRLLLQNETMTYAFSWTQSMDEAETIYSKICLTARMKTARHAAQKLVQEALS
jgi:hypothetical protein